MRRKVEYVRRIAFLHQTKIEQLIADAYMTFQGIRRGGVKALTQLEMIFRGAIFCQRIRERSPFIQRNLSKGQNLALQFLDDRNEEDTPLILIFNCVWFDTMMNTKKSVHTLT